MPMGDGVESVAGAAWLLVCVALAGCSGLAEDNPWSRPACSIGPGPSGNAPLHSLYAGSPEDIVRRVAAAFGDTVTGPSQTSAGHAFSSTRGTWRLEGDPPAVSFFGTGPDWLDGEGFKAGIDRLGLLGSFPPQPPNAGHDVLFLQLWNDAPVAEAMLNAQPDTISQGEGYGTFTEVYLGDMRDVRGIVSTVSGSAARETAEAFVACSATWPNARLSSYQGQVDVAYHSLVHLVGFDFPNPPGHHCATGHVQIQVDAETGTALGSIQSPCD